MAIDERSIGPVYLAHARMNRPFCPFHMAGIIEMVRPWRSGRAFVFPFYPFRAVLIGIWTRTIEDDVEDDFTDDRWLKPKWLDTVHPLDIANWSNGNEEEEEGGL